MRRVTRLELKVRPYSPLPLRGSGKSEGALQCRSSRWTTQSGFFRIAALAIVVSLLPPACHRPSHPEAKKQAEQRWNQVRAGVKLQLARQQYDGGLFDEVVRTVSESIGLDSTRPEAYVLLARANLELSRPASAEQALEAARRSGFDSADLHYMRGVILEQRNDLTGAVEEYAQARMLNAENVDYLVALAECLVALDRFQESLALLDENSHRFDDNGTVAVLAGRVAALLGDWDGAAKRLEQAAVILGDRSIVAEELGLLFVRVGRCEEAVALLRPLIDAAGESEAASVRRGIAACYLTLGDARGAKAVLIDYARLHLEDGPAQLLLARAALETNDLLTAARAASLAESVAPGRADIALVRAAVQWRRTEYAAAAETLYGLLEKEPANSAAYCLLAEVLRAQGQDDTARDCLKRALDVDPSCLLARHALDASVVDDPIPDSVGFSVQTPFSGRP